MKHLAFLTTLCLVLAGCTPNDLRVDEFHAGTPLVFNKARNLEVVMKEPATFVTYSGKKKPLPHFHDSLQIWTISTFVPAGEDGNLFVTFEEASVKEVPVKAKSTDLFSKDATSRFDAKLAVRLELINGLGAVEGSAFARAEHSITLYDEMSPAERERRLKQLCEDVIHDLDEQIRPAVEDGLRSGLKPYVQYGISANQ